MTIHLEEPDDRNRPTFRNLISPFGLRPVVEGATFSCNILTVSISSAPLHGNCCPKSHVRCEDGLDAGKVSLFLFLDMSSAFATVDHNRYIIIDHDILRDRLEKTVRQSTIQWFKTLSGRIKQYYLHPPTMLNRTFSWAFHRAP